MLSHFLAGRSRVYEPYVSARERMGLIITEHSYQWIPSEGASYGHKSQYTDLLQPASTSASRCTPTQSKVYPVPCVAALEVAEDCVLL